MAIFLGVCVAACYGSGDFCGGLAAKRLATVGVLALAQACALTFAVVYAVAFTGDPTGRDLGLGAMAGASGLVGLGLLYYGLATGRMGVVAPITAVVAAVVPVTYATATGEDPSAVALMGVGCAIVAGGMIAAERGDVVGATLGRDALLSVLAGSFFGVSFIAYAETSDDSGFWPILTSRGTALPLALAAVALTRTAWRAGPREARLGLAAGFLDVSATAMLLVAVRDGLASLVAPLAALAPAFTVVLAWIVLHEPIARLQIAGLALALVGLTLIAAG